MFAPFHRGGSGPPLVCLHGFMDTWRTWELVLPALERRHDVLAPTLAGHAGGPPIEGAVTDRVLAYAVERAMDDAGFASAHLAGSSLGGHVALQLAERGRARSVTAFAPAGGWLPGDPLQDELFRLQGELLEQLRHAAPYADAIAATPEGRRRATRLLVESYEHIPPGLIAHITRAAAAAPAAERLLAHAADADWSVHAERIDCPVRIAWGTHDRLLPWPRAAVRFRAELPHADWVELDGVGHHPQLEVPLEAAQLILGMSAQYM